MVEFDPPINAPSVPVTERPLFAVSEVVATEATPDAEVP
jgi:hypothetical protein